MMQPVEAWLTQKVGRYVVGVKWEGPSGRGQAGGLTVVSAGAFGCVDGG